MVTTTRPLPAAPSPTSPTARAVPPVPNPAQAPSAHSATPPTPPPQSGMPDIPFDDIDEHGNFIFDGPEPSIGNEYSPAHHPVRVPVNAQSPPPEYRGDPIPRHLVADWNARKNPKKKLHVVLGGIESGMFRHWTQAGPLVINVKNNCHQSFNSVGAAWDYWAEACVKGNVWGPVSSSSLVGPVYPGRRPGHPAPTTTTHMQTPTAAPAPHESLRTFAVSTTTFYVPQSDPVHLSLPNPTGSSSTSRRQ